MAEPVSLAQAKAHLRVTSASEDDLINGIISDARAWVENYTGQTLRSAEVTEFLDRFGDRITTWPINSIASVTYRDSGGTELTLDAASYRAAYARRPARLSLLRGAWPTTTAGPGVIKVTMQAGYADGAVPRGMIRAMLLLITGYYEQRDTGGLSGEVEAAAKAACGTASRSWRI